MAAARILLVKDQPKLRAVSERALRRLGYDVVAVTSGEEALTRLLRDGERVDLVICDLHLDGMDGLAVYDALRALSDRTPFMLASGAPRDVVFLEKPSQLDELLDAVRRFPD